MSPTEYKDEFGNRVRDLRLARGLSQQALADAAGLHFTHISLIERGQRSARIETIVKLAIALDVQPRKLMPTLTRQEDDLFARPPRRARQRKGHTGAA